MIEFRLKKYLLVLALSLSPLTKAYAHGGGASEKAPEKVEKPHETRVAAKNPDVLADSELRKLKEFQKTPEDVILVRCTLSEYAVCRGLDVALYDLAGKRVLMANTGTEGVVGFQGLRANTKYIAKIDNEKYLGEIEARGGQFLVINGDRKN